MAINLFSLARTSLQNRRNRRDIAKLVRHDPRLIRDMGLNPADVYEAANATWDDLPDRYRTIEG